MQHLVLIAAISMKSFAFEYCTTVQLQDNLWLFGGSKANHVITDELWSYNVTDNQWLAANSSGKAPYLIGHSAHVIKTKTGKEVMLVFFGYSPYWGVSPFVFKFDLGE